MNTSVRNGLFVGVGALLLIVAGTFYFLNKPIEISKKDWVEINSDNNTGEQIVNAKDGSFSIKLSKNWFIEEPTDERISFYPQKTNSCKIDFFVTEAESSLENIKNEFDNSLFSNSTLIYRKSEFINFKDRKSLRLLFETYETGVSASIITQLDKKQYKIRQNYLPAEKEVCNKSFDEYVTGYIPRSHEEK